MRASRAALRRRLAATRRVWRPGSEHLSVFAVPGAAVRPQLQGGHLDEPRARTVLARAPVTIRGWALFAGGPASKVEAWLGDEPLGTASLGVPRPDIKGASGSAAGLIAGFELMADLEHWSGSEREVALRVRATGPAGERFHLPPVPVRVAAPGELTGPDPDPPASEPILSWPQAGRSNGGGALRVLVFTHQLDLGGAQLYLLDLLRGLSETGDVECTVTSPTDGALRESLEALGIPVHISGALPIDDPAVYAARVEELAAWAAHGGWDAIFVNTMVAFAGGEVAARTGIPSVWAIHESHDPAMRWWMAFGPTLHPEVRGRARAALAGAGAAVFESEATLEQYRPHVPAGRCVKADYGLDLRRLDEARAEFDPELARRERGIAPDAVVVICVGMIEPRKAQSSLVQAFGLVAERHPGAQLVLVGARHDFATQVLEEYLGECGPPGRVELLPVLPDVWSWYGAADLLVSASNLESLPRSVLEAMAWETPVLATTVFGLPELIEHGETGWLCPPRDIRALADALDVALSAGESERRRIGVAGRELVERRHDQDAYAREMTELVRAVAAGEWRAAGPATRAA